MAVRGILDGVRRFVREQDGPTATEYAVILALILVVIIATVTVFGQSLATEYQDIDTSLFA